MRVVLSPQESEKFFYDALCNAVGTGHMSGYGLQLQCEREHYKASKEHLVETGQSACYEDVMMQVLKDGGTLTFEDVEGEGEMTRSIALKDVHRRVQKTPFAHLADAINENDDAITADVILQTVFFKDVIFG